VNRLQKYRALTPGGRAIVLHSLLLLPLVAAHLRSRGMARTTALLERLGHRSNPASDALPPREIARLVNAAASILRALCLPRSLVLWHFLRHRGVFTEIRFGVSRPDDGKFAAHAWVELDGLPLNDSADILGLYWALPAYPTRIRADRL
jgi:hypothetical protein